MPILYIPPRGDLSGCWINQSQVVSVYTITLTVFIELPHTTIYLTYETNDDANRAESIIICILNINHADHQREIPRPVSGGFRTNNKHNL